MSNNPDVAAFPDTVPGTGVIDKDVPLKVNPIYLVSVMV